ncbi:MAG: GNAT family N-acetyltransferase [Chthoniobacterales bacterium]
MILISWMRFGWDLKKSDLATNQIPSPFHIRKAEADEESTVHKTVNSAFSIDGAWSDAWKTLKESVEHSITESFARNDGSCLVITHGIRIIGASVMDPNPAVENNLLTGPCILHEYRSRGLGTLLLRESLRYLKDAGLEKAHGISRDRTVAARFVYKKFSGVGASYNSGPQIAAKLTI